MCVYAALEQKLYHMSFTLPVGYLKYVNL